MKSVVVLLLCFLTICACTQNKTAELIKIKPIPKHDFVELSEPGHTYFRNFNIVQQTEGQLLICTSVQQKNNTSQDPSLELIKIDDNLKIYSHLKVKQPYSILAIHKYKDELILAVENYETHVPAILHINQFEKLGLQNELPIQLSSKCISELDKTELLLFDKITDRYGHERFAYNSYNFDGKLKRDITISDKVIQEVLSPYWFAPVGSYLNKEQGVTFAVIDTLNRTQYLKRISWDGNDSYSSMGYKFPISAITSYRDTTYVCGILEKTNQLQISELDSFLSEKQRIVYDNLKSDSWIKGIIRLPNGFAILNNFFLTNEKVATTNIQILFFDLHGDLVSSEEIGNFRNDVAVAFEILAPDKVCVFGWTSEETYVKANRLIYGTVEIPEKLK